MHIPPLPKKLYKYREINEFTKDIVINNRVYFAAPPDLTNEPFDCSMTLGFDCTDDELVRYLLRAAELRHPGITPSQKAQLVQDGLLKRPHQNPDFIREQQNRYDELVRNSSGFCMSELPNNNLMFTHYADSHKGCCLEFELTRLDEVGRAFPIDYYPSDNFPDFNFYRLHEHPEEIVRRKFFTKGVNWKYEQEWRTLRYLKPAGTVSFRPNALTGLIFGCRMSESDKETVRSWLRCREQPLVLYQATVNHSPPTLDIIPVT